MKNYILLIVSILSLSAYSMDQTHGYIKDDKVIVFELMLHHGSIFNHHLVCALALVNKHGNEFIKNTDTTRKKYFSKRLIAHLGEFPLTWHPRGTAYAHVFFAKAETEKETKLTVRYNYLLDKEWFFPCKASWYNDPHPLLCNPKPFFNDKGNACFYAFGIIDVLGYGKQREIIEYSISHRGKKKRTRCVLGVINDKKEFMSVSLAQLAKHTCPDLMRAIFNSKITYKLSTHWHKDRVKVFHWDGVTLPPGYPQDGRRMNFSALSGKTYSNARAARN